MPPAIITAALVSAAVGAVTAAVTGGNILKGALLGAVGGAVGATFLGAGTAGAASTAGTAGAAGEVATSVAGDAMLPGALGVDGVAMSTAPLPGTALASAPFESGLDMASGVRESAVAAPSSTSTLGSAGVDSALGGSVQGTGIGVEAPQALYQGSGESGLFNAAKDSQLASAQLGLGPDASPVSAAVPATQPSAIESMWDRVFGKDGYMDRPGSRGLVGAGLQGMAQGANTQKLLDARREQEERARQNAKFGTQTSRFAPVGLVSKATDPYRG